MSSDNTDRVIRDLEQTLNNMPVPPDAQGGEPIQQALESFQPVYPIRGNPQNLRSGIEISEWEGTLQPSQRDAWRREVSAARLVLNDWTNTRQAPQNVWCMGIRVGERHFQIAHDMARQDPALKPHVALCEIARVEAEELRGAAQDQEMARRRERMERNQRSLPQNRGHHPMRDLLDAMIGARGSVYTSPAILEKCAISLDIQRFVDVLKDICVEFGNLTERPSNGDMQFSLNFTPRLDTPRPAITVNIMSPLEAKFVIWNELDGTWNVRHNVVGASARNVSIQPYQPETNPPVIRDSGCLHDEEVGKQSRSIQLD